MRMGAGRQGRMRSLALLFLAAGLVGTAAAQNSASRPELFPIPNALPERLYDPAPIAGAMPQPLADSAPAAEKPATSIVKPAAPAASTAAEAETPASPPAREPNPAPVESATAPDDNGAADITSVPADDDATPAEVPPEPTPAPVKPPPKPSKAEVTVIVEGVAASSGNVNVAICDKGLSREGCPYTTEVPAKAGFVEARFENIPPGTYAVVGYHDVNGNNQFDKFLGMPREPYALSNGAGNKMVPTFRDAALSIKKGDNTVIIQLQSMLGGS